MPAAAKNFDIRSIAFKRDPAPTCQALREAGPLVQVRFPLLGPLHMATTHAAVEALLKDDANFSVDFLQHGTTPLTKLMRWAPGPLRLLSENMLQMDGADHRRLRKLVDAAGPDDLTAERREQARALNLMDGGDLHAGSGGQQGTSDDATGRRGADRVRPGERAWLSCRLSSAMKRVEVVDYDPRWAESFEVLRAAAARGFAAAPPIRCRIEHVGRHGGARTRRQPDRRPGRRRRRSRQTGRDPGGQPRAAVRPWAPAREKRTRSRSAFRAGARPSCERWDLLPTPPVS